MSSSSRMRPSSGATKPAIESSTRVLPAPLGPNSTVTPAVAENSRSREKPAESGRGGRVLWRRASSIAVSNPAGAEAIGQRQDDQRDGRNHQHQRSSHRAVARFHGVVNGHRQSLRTPGDVARYHESDPEVAERTGESERRRGQNRAPLQRQRHTPEQA